MAYSVFLSHSMTPEDEPFVRTIVEQLRILNIQCYIAEHDGQFGQSLAAKVELALRNCDCLLALLTMGGSQSSYVNQEIGLAVGLNKPIIPIVEKGVDLRGFKAGVEWVEFDRKNPQACLLKLAPHMVGLAAAKEKSTLIGTMVLAGLGIWLLNQK